MTPPAMKSALKEVNPQDISGNELARDHDAQADSVQRQEKNEFLPRTIRASAAKCPAAVGEPGTMRCNGS